jgi:hypothetical protein
MASAQNLNNRWAIQRQDKHEQLQSFSINILKITCCLPHRLAHCHLVPATRGFWGKFGDASGSQTLRSHGLRTRTRHARACARSRATCGKPARPGATFILSAPTLCTKLIGKSFTCKFMGQHKPATRIVRIKNRGRSKKYEQSLSRCQSVFFKCVCMNVGGVGERGVIKGPMKKKKVIGTCLLLMPAMH